MTVLFPCELPSSTRQHSASARLNISQSFLIFFPVRRSAVARLPRTTSARASGAGREANPRLGTNTTLISLLPINLSNQQRARPMKISLCSSDELFTGRHERALTNDRVPVFRKGNTPPERARSFKCDRIEWISLSLSKECCVARRNRGKGFRFPVGEDNASTGTRTMPHKNVPELWQRVVCGVFFFLSRRVCSSVRRPHQ
ncbi:hypothetical protein E2C01_090192 [Portunus trituberculatus]|uniref:Uncharacterized protein n=1 Tax=Portunus trituberculatus TaxID=210409 RepID=A0A5B7JE14_PORTR|nr:hypothetical protein [Portunus trituberculatus]